MKIALGIAYNGADYYGWQKQKTSDNTLQHHVEHAISRVADESTSVICAGRTDSGVHALNQVIHFETNVERSQHAWVRGSNSNLPNDISVRWCRPQPDDFHARYGARERWYRYIIFNHPLRPAILDTGLTWEPRPLALKPMQKAAKHLVGEHDFTSFRTLACQAKSPVRTIKKLQLVQQGDYIIMDVVANAFLHHMIRNLAGTLMMVGKDEQPPDWVKEVLGAKDRSLAGMTAAAHGLYLMNVEYEKQFDVPQVMGGPLFL